MWAIFKQFLLNLRGILGERVEIAGPDMATPDVRETRSEPEICVT